MSRPAAPRVRPDGGAAGVIEKQRPVSKRKPGAGFAAHPENICRDGAAKSKGRQLQNLFREWVEATPDGDDKPRINKFLEYLEDIASAANKQSVEAIKLILERAYGKPMQPITGDLNVTATMSLSESAALMNGRVIPKGEAGE